MKKMQLFLGVVLACVCGTVNATDYRVTVKTDRSVYAAGDVLLKLIVQYVQRPPVTTSITR